MSLIKPEKKLEFISTKFRITQELNQQIQDYCQYAGIEDSSHFISEACQYVFSKDKGWQACQKKTAKQVNS